MGHNNTFHALVARQDDNGIRAEVETLEKSELPGGEVTVGCTIPVSITKTHWR